MSEPCIAGEEEFEGGTRKAKQRAVLQTLHSERQHGFHLMPFGSQGGGEFVRQILVEQDSHAARPSSMRANSRSAPPIASADSEG